MKISKKLFIQFEQCKKSGECSMLDIKCILDYCLENKLVELCNMTKEQYAHIVEHYSYLSSIYNKR